MSENHQNLNAKMEPAQHRWKHAANIRAVIFDLDDTLWPIIPLIHDAEQALFNWLQTNAPKIVGQHSIESLRRLRQQLIPANPRFSFDLWALRHAMLTQLFATGEPDPQRVKNLADNAMQVFARARNRVSLYDDVIPALTELGQRFKLGSISNGFADLEQIGLARHFHVSLAAHEFGSAKPDPRIFQAACASLGVALHEAIYVGDDVVIDVQGARRAGLHSVWINRATHMRAPRDHEADFECRDLAELTRWLQT